MAIAAIVVIGIIWFAVSRPHATTYQLFTAKRGTLAEIVSITGNVTSTKDADLAFENGGTIAAVYKNEGDHVVAGNVIAKLDTQDLEAQLAEAQANVDAQNATLKKLQAGPTPENIAVSQTALNTAAQMLQNSYASVPNAIASAYTSANDAVRNQLSTFFTNAEANNPQLTFPVSNSQLVNNIVSERAESSVELNEWQTEEQGITSATPSSTLDALLQNTLAHLSIVKTLLTNALNAIVNSTNITNTTATAYKTDITNGLDEVNTSIGNVNTISQSIASEKASVAQAQAALNLTLAGATTEDIDAQAAQVEQAKASAQTIQVKIDKASLIAPLSGIVTTQNAKVGEIASPGIPIVSLLADNGLEIYADIAEADIGKVNIGDPTSMTLDAFQGKTFSGKVTYVNPGETLIEGVPTYKTMFQFDNLDPGTKTGMTANIDITTAVHDNVLFVPQRAVTTNADGSRTVEIYHGAKQPLTTQAVTVGIRDTNGNIEIVSGLSEGDTVARTSQ
jgi:HlyD family secretion protein